MKLLTGVRTPWLDIYMNTNTATKFQVRTGSGVVHSLTDGRAYTQRGERVHNSSASVIGKADCGAQTSSAAQMTDEPVNCPKCLG